MPTECADILRRSPHIRGASDGETRIVDYSRVCKSPHGIHEDQPGHSELWHGPCKAAERKIEEQNHELELLRHANQQAQQLIGEESRGQPKSETEKWTADHLKHVQQFLTEMYQVMVDPVEEFDGNIAQLCELLIKRAKQDRETIHSEPRDGEPSSAPPASRKGASMNYEVGADKKFPQSWRVEAIDFDGEGDCFVAVFDGPHAEKRAREYAAWKESGAAQEVSPPSPETRQIWDSITRVAESRRDDDTCRLSQRACQKLLGEKLGGDTR